MLLDQSKFKERFDTHQGDSRTDRRGLQEDIHYQPPGEQGGRSFFREVFIRRGTTSGVYGVEEPRECYMTYTTERAEKEALKLYSMN